MPSTFSSSLRTELIGNGEQAGTWGTTTNTNLGTVLEAAIAGYTSVTTSTAKQALTVANGAADQARSAMLALNTSTGANFEVYAPPVSKLYAVRNVSSYTVTLYNSTSVGNTTAAGLGVAVPAGRQLFLMTDGVDFRVLGVIADSANTPNTVVERDGSGDFAAGTITADLIGDVTGNLTGDVLGDVTGNLTGDVTGNVSGNAGTVTNGVYTTGNQTIGGVKTFSSPIVAQNVVPAGAVMHFAMNSAPSGWLEADGSLVSRTTYAALFAAVGTTFGAGDGSTTFALPDLRGEFIRGWDDGRGVDSGRGFGSAQADGVKESLARIRSDSNGNAFSAAVGGTAFTGEFSAGGATTTSTTMTANGTIQPMHYLKLGSAPETRPRNVALLACIKF